LALRALVVDALDVDALVLDAATPMPEDTRRTATSVLRAVPGAVCPVGNGEEGIDLVKRKGPKGVAGRPSHRLACSWKRLQVFTGLQHNCCFPETLGL
jgi:hypothetical protein